MFFKKNVNKNKEIRNAFRFYILGSIMQWQYFEHDRFNDENFIDGFDWAIKLIDSYFEILNSSSLQFYQQKGKLNIYVGQELNQFTKILMDLYEMLIYGNYSNINKAYDMDQNLINDMKIKLISITHILRGKNSKELAFQYKKLLLELGIGDE